MAGDPAVADHEPDELAGDPVAGGLLQRGPAHEVAGLGQLDDAAETRLERVGRPVELVAVEGHAGLEPERVARPQPDRDLALGPTRLEQGVPQLDGAVRVDEQLEPVLARVARARELHRDPGDLPSAIP